MFNPPVGLRDEGGTESKPIFTIDCVGAGISCSQSGTTGTLTVSGGASTNSFETISVPAGTNPVADSATDTLTITETSFLTITGTAGTDTIAITQVTTDIGTDGLIAADAVALATNTTGDYVSTVADGSGIDVTGTAGENWTATVNLLYTDTLAGNPAMNADECRFSTDGTGGGVLCEGAADLIEGLLVWSPTTADRTLTLPDVTDTLVGRDTTDTLTNKTLAAASNVIDADTAVALAADPADCGANAFATTIAASGALTCATPTLSTDTNGNYVATVVDGAGIDVTGTAGEGWTATVNLLYTDTLAGNPAMNADESRFSTDGTGGGILFEGAADLIEGLLVWNPATSDRTLTLPDATDTVVGRATTDTLTNKTLAAADNVINADTAVTLAANGANCAAGNYPLGVDTAGAVESCTAAGGVAGKVGITTGNATTTSDTLVDIGTADQFLITATTGANPVLISFVGSCEVSTTGDVVAMNIHVDGSTQFGSIGVRVGQGAVGENFMCGFTYLSNDLTAASHTFEPKWSVSGGATATMECSLYCGFSVVEVED